MEKITTVKVFEETKDRLNKLKEFERESYDQVLRKILHILNVCRQNPMHAKRILEDIEDSMKREKTYDSKKEGIY
jgi:hypothetical protein